MTATRAACVCILILAFDLSGPACALLDVGADEELDAALSLADGYDSSASTEASEPRKSEKPSKWSFVKEKVTDLFPNLKAAKVTEKSLPHARPFCLLRQFLGLEESARAYYVRAAIGGAKISDFIPPYIAEFSPDIVKQGRNFFNAVMCRDARYYKKYAPSGASVTKLWEQACAPEIAKNPPPKGNAAFSGPYKGFHEPVPFEPAEDYDSSKFDALCQELFDVDDVNFYKNIWGKHIARFLEADEFNFAGAVPGDERGLVTAGPTASGKSPGSIGDTMVTYGGSSEMGESTEPTLKQATVKLIIDDMVESLGAFKAKRDLEHPEGVPLNGCNKKLEPIISKEQLKLVSIWQKECTARYFELRKKLDFDEFFYSMFVLTVAMSKPFIYETTLGNPLKALHFRMSLAAAKGYAISVYYPVVPSKDLVKRAKCRGIKAGRTPSEEAVLSMAIGDDSGHKPAIENFKTFCSDPRVTGTCVAVVRKDWYGYPYEDHPVLLKRSGAAAITCGPTEDITTLAGQDVKTGKKLLDDVIVEQVRSICTP